MKKIIVFIVSLAVFFLINSCQGEGDFFEPDYTGLSLVLDANGDPVAGAKIVASFEYNLYDIYGVMIEPVVSSAYTNLENSISGGFYLGDSAHLKIWIQDYITKEVIKVVYYDYDYFGAYSWDKMDNGGKYVLNGVYETVLNNVDRGDTVSYEYPLYHGYENVAENEIIYLTSTNSEGLFDMPRIVIPDYEEKVIDSLGNIIAYRRFSEYFKLWAVKDGMDNFYLDSVRVNNYGYSVTIRP